MFVRREKNKVERLVIQDGKVWIPVEGSREDVWDGSQRRRRG